MNDREKWYEKTWEWIKKYWGIVLSAVALAVGYIIGRKQSVSGLDVNIEYAEVVQKRKEARARIQALTFPSISSTMTQKETLYGSI
jgi:hypothetical protein